MDSNLIPVAARDIDGVTVQTCSARDLHKFLEIQTAFKDWINRRVADYKFLEGVDYLIVKSERQVPHQGGMRSTTISEFYLSIGMGKELAMVERTQRGKEVRQYFIECERRASAQVKPLTQGEILLAQCQMLVEQERRVAALETANVEHADKIKRIEAKQQAFEEGSKFFTVVGYAVWRGFPAVTLSEAAALGKRATRISKEKGLLIDKVRDPRFGIVGSYHESILEIVFAELADGL